jgi:hypothetical protein
MPDVVYRLPVTKLDEDKRLAFGWAYQAKTKDGEVVEDHSRKVIPMSELEPAAYKFMVESRLADEMHQRVKDEGGNLIGEVVESVVITQEKLVAWGLAKDAMPEGWWVGIKVYSDEVWGKVKDRTYRMFSVTGIANETPYESAA